jgi:hypothetical protein
MPSSTRRHSHLSTALIWLLLCSNLATALLACLVIDRLNERYAGEINSTVPGLHEVILLAQEATNTHRAALNLLMAADEAERDEVRQRLDEARRREGQRLRQIFPDGGVVGSPREPLWEASDNYGTALDRFLELVQVGDHAAAVVHRASVLRPAFDNYQRLQREESIRLNFEAIRSGAEIHAMVTTRKGLLLGFGVWPLLLASLMLVIVGVLGAMLWRHVRQIEREEGLLRTDENTKF